MDRDNHRGVPNKLSTRSFSNYKPFDFISIIKVTLSPILTFRVSVEKLKSIKTLIKDSKGLESNQILYKLSSIKDFKYPEKLQKDYDLIEKKWNNRERNDYLRNQENLCISEFHIKDKKIYLSFCEAKYLQRQILSECFGMLSDLDQEILLSDINDKKIKVPLAYKAVISIITKDNKLLVVKRSSKVSTNKGKLDFSISKSAKIEDLEAKSFQPYQTIIRALKEELNIDLDFKIAVKEKTIKITDYFFNKETFSIGYSSVVDFRDSSMNITSEQIFNLYKDAKNSWEISDIYFITNSQVQIKKELKKNQDKFTNHALKNISEFID